MAARLAGASVVRTVTGGGAARLTTPVSASCAITELHNADSRTATGNFYIDEEDAGPDLPASLTLDELKLVCEARDAFAELKT